MVNFFSKAVILAIAASPLVKAQTSSACNPLQKSCPADAGLNQASYTVDFTKGMPSDWSMTFQSVTIDPTLGAKFTVNGYDDAPTMQSNWYLFFGTVECTFQAAPGAGVVSSFILISDDLDEIDVEVIGSETTRVQSNYFGKGNTTVYDRGGFHNVASPQTSLHKYKLDWNQDRTIWSIDGNPVRTLNYGDAVGGKNYPQTPMQIRLGNWVAGRPGNAPGTVTWAGGIADLSQAPFNFYVQSCTVTNQNPASSYTYGDESGSYQSINGGNNAGAAPAPPALSSTTPAAPSNATPISPNPPVSNPVSSSVAATTSSTSSVASSPTETPTTTSTSTAQSVTEVPQSSAEGSSSGAVTTTSSTVIVTAGGANTTFAVHTPTTATTSGPAQVTTNAAAGSYGKSTVWGLGAVMGLALLF